MNEYICLYSSIFNELISFMLKSNEFKFSNEISNFEIKLNIFTVIKLLFKFSFFKFNNPKFFCKNLQTI